MIIKFNKNMPPAYQIGINKKDLVLYLIPPKKGNEISSQVRINVLKTGTKVVLKTFIEGMLGALDIAKEFQNFQNQLNEIKDGKEKEDGK